MIVEPRGGVSGVVNPYSAQPPQGPHQSSEKEANGQSTHGRTKAKLYRDERTRPIIDGATALNAYFRALVPVYRPLRPRMEAETVFRGRILVTTWMIWPIFIYNFQNMQLLARTAKKEPTSCNSNFSQTQLRQMQLEICLVTTLSDNLNVSNSRVRRVGLELSRVGGPSGSTASSGNIV
ncbi:hypothetical protein C8R45DRAFT_944276 [Mycena sanguinolenta]|nr:hypothetical protein C8R45DRAFT_944276 [Mycena sanguinolenta]